MLLQGVYPYGHRTGTNQQDDDALQIIYPRQKHIRMAIIWRLFLNKVEHKKLKTFHKKSTSF